MEDALLTLNNTSLDPMLQLALIIGSLIGVVMAGVGIFQIATSGQNRGQSSHGIGYGAALTLTGSVLTATTGSGALVQLTLNSFYGGGVEPEMALAYVAPSANPASAWLLVLSNFVVFLGWIAVIRGLMYLGIAGSRREKGLGAGVTFLVAGTLMTNPIALAQMIGYSLGVQDVVNIPLP